MTKRRIGVAKNVDILPYKISEVPKLTRVC